jgi:microcystin-dependent protein
MGTISYVVPVAGTDLNSIADPEISTALTTILTWANGGIDASNLSSAFLAQFVLPIGAIAQYTGATDPTTSGSTWVICDGRAVNRTTYAMLFDTVSTTYGSGDGSTTFNIPDFRGRVPVGADSGGVHLPSNHPALGTSGGEEQHTLSTTEMPSHSHTISGTWLQYNGGGATANTGGSGIGALGIGVSNTGGGGAHNNLQPYVAINHIIRVL